MSFGLTLDGFNPKTLTEIKTEIEDTLKSVFGASINLDPNASIVARLLAIFAERESLLWDLALAVYNAQDPDKALGAALNAVCAITGTSRLDATNSEVTLYFVGDSGITAPLNFQAQVDIVDGELFETLAPVTLTIKPNWVTLTPYVLGQIVINASKSYLCIVAGTTGAVAPTHTTGSVVDGTVTWFFLGLDVFSGFAETSALNVGPIVASSGTLNEIVTPISGLTSVINPYDAKLGTNIETDSALRLRREIELQVAGNSPLNALRAAILRVGDVTSCIVFEGTGFIECLVEGGLNQDIAEKIFDSKAAGVTAIGDIPSTVIDDSNIPYTVSFSRPDEIEIWIIISLKKTLADYPVDGDQQVKDAIVAKGNTLQTGNDVVSSFLGFAAFGVSGVFDVYSVLIGVAPAPTLPNTITILTRERAKFDTSRITVVATTGSL